MRIAAPAIFIGVLAAVAALLASLVEPDGARIVMEIAIAAAATIGGFRAGAMSVSQARSAELRRATATTTAESIVDLSPDRRRPIIDRQTGLCADWYFRLRLQEEIARAERFSQCFSVIRMRADARVARALKQLLRHIDYAADIGEAYAVVLPNTDREGARTWADRIHLNGAPVESRVAQYPIDGRTVRDLLGEEPWGSFIDDVPAA